MRVASGVMAAFALVVWAARASAHVDVLPTEAVAGAAERFTIRVPSERDVDTVSVRVEFPQQITVYSVKPSPGWTVQTLLRPDGRTRAVLFSGGRISPGQFMEFDVLGTPFEEGTAVWRSFQRYRDGVVKRWTGPPEEPGAAAPEASPDEPGPAAATEVSAEGDAASPAASSGSGDGEGDSSAAVWLGVIAIAIAAAAALGVGLLWSSRPMTLPEDRD